MAIGAAAGAAAVAGVGASWWRTRREAAEDSSAAPDLWSMTFQTPAGAPLRMADLRGRPLLLNFWATWCGPCVVEMPLLNGFAKERATSGWHVLALAIDGLEPVRRFVSDHALELPVAIAGAEGIDLSRSLGNKLGALPFSVVFDAKGEDIARNLGAVSPGLLTAWLGLTR